MDRVILSYNSDLVVIKSNWKDLLMPRFSIYILMPALLVATVSAVTPIDLLNSTPNTWIQLPDTKLKSIIEPIAFNKPISAIVGPKAIMSAWNGAVWNESEQRMDIIASGGHADYLSLIHI